MHPATVLQRPSAPPKNPAVKIRSPAFDAVAEAARLKAETRARRPRRSRLDRYAHELLALADEGCTTAELRRWLADRRVQVQHSTIARWLRRHGNG